MEFEKACKIWLVQRYRYTLNKTKQYQHQSQRGYVQVTARLNLSFIWKIIDFIFAMKLAEGKKGKTRLFSLCELLNICRP